MSFALAQYKSTRIETASPVQLVVDLYRGAISMLAAAMAHEEAGQPGERGRALGRAHAIVSELQATLDHAQAPDLCEELDRLYDFVLHQIREANINADASRLVSAVQVLQTLEEAWTELARRRA